MKKTFWVLLASFLITPFSKISAQGFNCNYNTETGEWQAADGSPCVNSIITAVPFLRIVPDARAGAMGDVGIATSPDPNAMHFNSSKLPFAESDYSVGVTYTPWLRSLGLTDVYLAYLSGYAKFGDKKDQAVGFGLRYFSLGQINFTDNSGGSLGTGRPNEFELNLGYVRKLSDYLSVGIGGKFIYSNLASGQTANNVEIKPGITGAADLSFTFTKPIKISGMSAKTTTGIAITNIGPKLSYTNSIKKDYLPTNFAIGTGLEMDFDEYNSLGFFMDFNKLMVPTPPHDPKDKDGNGQPDYKQQGIVEAMFNSFGDAPGGFSEELREFSVSTGIEYWYDKQFAVRGGYFWEHATKGNRQYLTIGLGLKYQIFNLNFSYLVPTSNQRNPLDNTLRFSLLFDIGNNAVGTDL